jgi:hypothetical protein
MRSWDVRTGYSVASRFPAPAMQDDRDPSSFSESNLESAEYRDRLRRKLDCLIAVLEVATAKVRQSLAGPSPDVPRLMRIQKNLQETLDVCLRARTALQKRGRLDPRLTEDLAAAVNPEIVLASSDPARPGGPELTDSERKRFARLPRIDAAMIGKCDFDELAKRLQL